MMIPFIIFAVHFVYKWVATHRNHDQIMWPLIAGQHILSWLAYPVGFGSGTSYFASHLITYQRFFRTRIMPYSCLFLEALWRVPDTQLVFNKIIIEWRNDPWNVEEGGESKGPLRCLAWVNRWKGGTHEEEHTGSKLMSLTLDVLSLTSYCISGLEIASK